jgi:Zn-dependent M28 family amino/carboxypeptidase
MILKYFTTICIALTVAASCSDKKVVSQAPEPTNAGGRDLSKVDPMTYANTITTDELTEQLYIYASDSLEGRDTGKPGQKKAVNYLRDQYMAMGVEGGMPDGSYFQPIPGTAFNRPSLSSENVLAFIEGTELPGEVLVLTAHLDHVGMENGQVYNGADDDGSGTIALVEIAEAFQKAKVDGYGPKRSILILHVTGEEIGLKGSKYYTENPIYPLENTIANLNVDMIGRVDNAHSSNPDYVYLIGSDRLSQDLHDISEAANQEYINMNLDYTFNAKSDPNRYYYRSDHYNFARENVPVIFYFNGVHEDYHAPTDTPDKINYPLLQRRAQLIFVTAWELANAETRPALNE